MRPATARSTPGRRPNRRRAGDPGHATFRKVAASLLAAIVALPGGGVTAPARAQAPATPAKHNNNTYGSPLDTLRSTRLWTDTPEPQAFVRETRPPPGTLDYAPLTGTDPERPKPRDPANVAALQAEMETAGARLHGGSGKKHDRHPPRRRPAAEAKPATR